MPPFARAKVPLGLLGMKLFTDYIAKLMGAGLKNIQIFRGKSIRLQRIYRQDSNRVACGGQRNSQG